MALTRKEKAKWNIATSVILQAVNVVNGFVLPRLILQAYGSAYNGITSSATQFLSMISILTIGVSASTRVALYQSLAVGDISKTSSIVRATELYMRRVGTILGVYILGLALIYPLAIDTGFGFEEVSSLIIIVGMSSFAEYFFGITYRTLLLADQSLYISNIFTIISVVLNLALSILLINMGLSIQLVKLGSATVFVIRPILQNIYIKRKYTLNLKCEPDESALSKRKDAMAHALANIVHDKTDLVVLTVLTDVMTVSVYTVYNLVIGALVQLQSVFTSGTEPIFGSMWANGEEGNIRRNLSFYEFFISVFSAIVYSVSYVMIIPFVNLYTKNITDVNYIRPAYAIVIITASVFYSFRTPYVALVQGAGHYRETRNAAITEAVLNVVFSVSFVLLIPYGEYKIVGVAVGTLIANMYRTIQYALYVDAHIVERGKTVFAKRVIWAFFNIILIVLIAETVIRSYLVVSNWPEWLLCAFITGTIACLVSIASSALFYSDDLRYAIRLLRETIFRKLHLFCRQNKNGVN